MRFEHLVQINDAANPLVTPMTRAELWRGLLARARTPQRFPLGPDRCELLGDHGDAATGALRRQIHFGGLVVDDHVHLDTERGLRFEPLPREGMPSVRLSITIEEPGPGDLFLRFVYSSDEAVAGEGLDAQLQGLREQAWLANDLDMVRTLREWQREGRL
jgi:hypothetical protein